MALIGFFEQIKYLEIHLADWVPIKGSSFIPLPSKIATKKAVINIKNDDDSMLQMVCCPSFDSC